MSKLKLFLFIGLSMCISCKETVNGSDKKETADAAMQNNIQETSFIKVLPVDTFKKEIEKENVQLADVRTPKEYGLGHLKNAKNINVLGEGFLKNAEAAFDKSKPIYVYCRSGKRSAKASAALKKAGFLQIYDMKGGFLAWSKENFETEK